MRDCHRRPGALAGATLEGGYQLNRVLEEGGMGAVYEGTQLRLGRKVAVKVMAGALAGNPEAVARFRREIDITARLVHPHIVQVLDLGHTPEGLPFLVMEYLEGEDLDRRLRRVGRLDLPAVLAMIEQAGSALAATHARGIVHRDLKPANLFLVAAEGMKDFVKVVDFGISKIQSAGSNLTRGSVLMGTPDYMAPEQVTGRAHKADHRTDQWALACIAWEALSGRPPFLGRDLADLLYQVVHHPPEPLPAGAAPDPVQTALQRALEKRPGDRFSSITAFTGALAAAGRSAPPPPRPRRAATLLSGPRALLRRAATGWMTGWAVAAGKI